MPDHPRNADATAYRELYRSAAWRKGRAVYLATNPLCSRCQAQGRITAATVVHHIKPHRGNLELFFSQANWEPLCKPHHDGQAQGEERSGWLRGSDANGRPRDSRHPWNNPR